PVAHLDAVADAMYGAGAGKIGHYSECGFEVPGTGTFRPEEGANPFAGQKGQRSRESEVRLETIVSTHVLGSVLAAMMAAHPYEEVAYDVYELANSHPYEGAGMVGELKEPQGLTAFLQQVKDTFGCGAIRYTDPVKEQVQRIAFCGG